MSGQNKAIIIGRLGADPEARTLTSGGKVVSFRVATGETWIDKATQERKEKTQWHRIAIFNDRLGDIAEKFLRKGNQVYIEGQIETREYEKDGQKRETTEIVLGRFKGELILLERNPTSNGDEASNDGRQSASRAAPARNAAPVAPKPSHTDSDDDLPF